MQNKKIVILIALGITAFISLIHGISSRPKWQKNADNQGMISNKTLGAANPENIVGQAKRHAKRTQFRSWKRSPFIPKGTAGTAYSKLSLSGILASGRGYKAMIGDSVVGKGDKVAGNTVVEVKADSVILNDGTKDFELKLAK